MNKYLLGDLLIKIIDDDDEAGVLRYAKLFIADGANINPASSSKHDTALLSAVRKGHVELAKLLIEKDAIINGISDQFSHETLLMIAVKKGLFDLVKILVEKVADINESNQHHSTALSIAREKNNKKIEEFLVQNGGIIFCPKSDSYYRCSLAEGHEGKCKDNLGKEFDGKDKT